MGPIGRREFLQRGLLLGGGAVLLGTVGAACTRGGIQQGGDGGSIRTLGEALPPLEALQGLSEKFTTDTGIQVNIEPYEFETALSKTIFDFTSGEANYDFVMGIYYNMGKYAANGMIVPVQELIDQNPNDAVDLSNMYQPVLDVSCIYQGDLYALPCTAQTMYLWYRKDLFEHPDEQKKFGDAYGYELPIPSSDNIITFDQFRDLAEFFTREAGDSLAGEALSNPFYGTTIQGKRHPAVFYEFANYIGAWGGSIIDDAGNVAVNDDAVVDALEYFVGLTKWSPPGAAEYTWDDALAVMQQGQIAMCIMWFDAAPALEDETQSRVAGKVGYAPNPKNVNLAHKYGGWAWYVNADSQNQEEAIQFIQWTNQPDVALDWLDGGGLPSNTEVINSDKYKSLPFNAGREVALQNITAWPDEETWTEEMVDSGVRAVSSAVAGAASPTAALDEFASKIEEIRGS